MSILHAKTGRTRPAALMLFVLLVAAGAQAARYDLFVETAATGQAAAPRRAAPLPAALPPATRARPVTLTPVIADARTLAPGDTLTLQLFGDTQYNAVIDRVTTNVNGTVEVRGRIEGSPFGYLVASTTNGEPLVSIVIPEHRERYRIHGLDGHPETYLLEIAEDQLDVLEGGPSLLPPVAAMATPLAGPPAVVETSASTTIGVMVVYTPAARTWAQGSGGIANVISQAVQKAQLAHDNSDTGIILDLVHSAEIDYTESGSASTDLNRLTWGSDGYMDQVHTWRDQYAADLVTIFASVQDVGGLSWLLDDTNGSPSLAFNLCRVQQVGWTYTYAHEAGHLMGCHHRKDQATQPGPGLYNFSAGWRWTGTDNQQYCSVLSYEDGPWTQVAYFSSPDVFHQGVATGDAGDADNARTVRLIRQVIANYRTASTPNNSPQTPSAVMPADGATGLGLTPVLEASPFTDPDGDVHANSQWQVDDNDAFTSPAWDSTTAAAATTTATVPAGRLSAATTYAWRVRYKDSRGAWSGWSAASYLTTASGWTLSGRVHTADGTGLGGVALTGLPGTPSTADDGSYAADVPYNWSGTVTPTKAGCAFTPPTRTYTNVIADQQDQDYEATPASLAISGYVRTLDGTPLAGVTIDGVPGSPTTTVDGWFEATVPYGWSGAVSPVRSGYTFSPSSRTYADVAMDRTNQTFTAEVARVTVSGVARTAGGAGVAGVVISGLPGPPVTDAGGAYSASVPYNWSGVVTPNKVDCTFDPPSRTYTNLTVGATGEGYVVTLPAVDLVVTDIAAVATIVAGQAAQVTVTIANEATAPAGMFRVDIWRDRADAPAGPDGSDSAIILSGVQAGGRTTCTFYVTWHDAGSYNLWALADGDNRLDEVSKSNNTASLQITVVSPGSQTAPGSDGTGTQPDGGAGAGSGSGTQTDPSNVAGGTATGTPGCGAHGAENLPVLGVVSLLVLGFAKGGTVRRRRRR